MKDCPHTNIEKKNNISNKRTCLKITEAAVFAHIYAFSQLYTAVKKIGTSVCIYGSVAMTSQPLATIVACFVLGTENYINLEADSHSGSNLLKRNIDWLKRLS